MNLEIKFIIVLLSFLLGFGAIAEQSQIPHQDVKYDFDEMQLDRSQYLPPNYIRATPNGVSFPLPGTYHSTLKTKTGEVVYESTITIDSFNRRIVPNQTEGRSQHALFLGCSWTFGEGSNDNQTIPYFFSRKSDAYRSYNLGFHGYSLNDILARIRLSRENYWAGINETEGVAFYLHMADHVKRLIGTLHYSYFLNRGRPYFYESDDGELINNGTFQSERPLFVKVFGFLSQLGFVRFLGLDFPPLGDRHWKFFARMLNEIRSEYNSRFPKGQFAVVLLPFDDSSPLIPYLEANSIPYLDFSQNFIQDLLSVPAFQKHDPHLTEAANKYLGERIAREFQEKNFRALR